MDNEAYIRANDEDQPSLAAFSQDGGSDTEGDDEECWCVDEELACFDHYGGQTDE